MGRVTAAITPADEAAPTGCQLLAYGSGLLGGAALVQSAEGDLPEGWWGWRTRLRVGIRFSPALPAELRALRWQQQPEAERRRLHQFPHSKGLNHRWELLTDLIRAQMQHYLPWPINQDS